MQEGEGGGRDQHRQPHLGQRRPAALACSRTCGDSEGAEGGVEGAVGEGRGRLAQVQISPIGRSRASSTGRDRHDLPLGLGSGATGHRYEYRIATCVLRNGTVG